MSYYYSPYARRTRQQTLGADVSIIKPFYMFENDPIGGIYTTSDNVGIATWDTFLQLGGNADLSNVQIIPHGSNPVKQTSGFTETLYTLPNGGTTSSLADSNRQWITYYYQQYLGRNPDALGTDANNPASFLARVNGGTITLEQARAAIANSQEAIDREVQTTSGAIPVTGGANPVILPHTNDLPTSTTLPVEPTTATTPATTGDTIFGIPKKTALVGGCVIAALLLFGGD